MFRSTLAIVSILAVSASFAASNSRESLNCSVSGEMNAINNLNGTSLVPGNCVLYNSNYEARVEKTFGGTMAKIIFLDGSSAMVKASTLIPAVESYVTNNAGGRVVLYNGSYLAKALVRYGTDRVAIKFQDGSSSTVKIETLAWEIENFEGFRSGIEVLYNSNYEARVLKVFNSGKIQIKFNDNSTAFVNASTLLKSDY